MKLEHEVYSALCSMRKLVINGIHAVESDFGEKYDRDSENAEDYACGDMQFTRVDAKPEVLAKYGINEKEYSEVCDVLESDLSFGSCGRCV
jgi:hypothetical protein